MITVDRYKTPHEYIYEISVGNTNGMNGTVLTVSQGEAETLNKLLASALGLGPGPEALARQPLNTNSTND